MRLLITRPEPDAKALQEVLRELGHEAVLAAMLTVRYLTSPVLDLESVQALVFTSANGVRAFAHSSGDQTDSYTALPVFAVGEATAVEGRAYGFSNVLSADGDVADLAAIIAKECSPDLGPLLHVAGTVVARDLGSLLESSGFTVTRAVLYEALTAEALPADVAALLGSQSLDGVLFYSPRTAETFAGLIAAANLQDTCRNMTGFCLSKAVAEKLSSLPFARLDIAANPDQDALLKLLPASSH